MKIDGQGQAETLSPDELEKLLDNAPCERSRALFSVMTYTGSRVGESLQLRWLAIQDSQLIFLKRTTKTKTTRSVLLHNRLIDELKAYKEFWTNKYGRVPNAHDYLFIGRWGNEPLTRQWGHKSWFKAVKKAGLKAGTSTHTPRRSLATTMHSKGIGLKTIASFTGHTSTDQLCRYVDIALEEKMKALDALS